MLNTTLGRGGMISAPHQLASAAGRRVLAEGGNAAEAMIAAAAMIAVAYPHTNALGGDNFWLLRNSNGGLDAIEATGPAAALASLESYSEDNVSSIPSRGPRAALTVAGAVLGWQAALETAKNWGGRLPLGRLLEDARDYAKNGIAVSRSQSLATAAKLAELKEVPGFAPTFLGPNGSALTTGALLRQPRLATTLDHLVEAGLDDFYRGDLARSMARELEALGSPLRLADLENYHTRRVEPLMLETSAGRLINMPPPTQGLASLLLLGIFDQLSVKKADDFTYLHAMIEATKRAFAIRDRFVTDPDYMDRPARDFLKHETIFKEAQAIDLAKAQPWGKPANTGDTVWLGAIDGEGRAVSFIQSIYWEYGSGVVLPESGVLWQNRGTSFSLDPNSTNPLTPGRRPFHTIQPALAELKDGRVMVYGCMGGDGQPQTQAAVFSRYALFGQSLQGAVTAPRWLLGRTWGSKTSSLRLEARFDPEIIEALKQAGHDLEVIEPFSEVMGHAGAVVRRPDGLLEGASDPRSDGAALAC